MVPKPYVFLAFDIFKNKVRFISLQKSTKDLPIRFYFDIDEK